MLIRAVPIINEDKYDPLSPKYTLPNKLNTKKIIIDIVNILNKSGYKIFIKFELEATSVKEEQIRIK